jgi:cysteinyl-tRNA synthetase
MGISAKAKTARPGFAVIPQNGIELVSSTGDEDGAADTVYLNAIDANGQEDLFYGYDNDDQLTDASATEYLRYFLDISKNAVKQYWLLIIAIHLQKCRIHTQRAKGQVMCRLLQPNVR